MLRIADCGQGCCTPIRLLQGEPHRSCTGWNAIIQNVALKASSASSLCHRSSNSLELAGDDIPLAVASQILQWVRPKADWLTDVVAHTGTDPPIVVRCINRRCGKS